MAKHYCNKEVQLAEMHKDIKYIIKCLDGNGKPGLVEKVEQLHGQRGQQQETRAPAANQESDGTHNDQSNDRPGQFDC